MNERNALEKDYLQLHEGHDCDAESIEYRNFYSRIGLLWVEGKESHGKRGIVPANPSSCVMPYIDLDFFVIREESKVRYRCGAMHPSLGAIHSDWFRSMCEWDNAATEDADQDGRWKEMKLTDAEDVVPIKPPEATRPVTPPVWRPRKAPKKPRKSDPFDPLDGLLY